jgi:hypothetical protein
VGGKVSEAVPVNLVKSSKGRLFPLCGCNLIQIFGLPRLMPQVLVQKGGYVVPNMGLFDGVVVVRQ